MLDNPATRTIAGLAMITVVFGFILWLMPTYPLPTEITQALDWFFTTLWQFDFVFPIWHMVNAFWILILADTIILGVKLVLWIKKHATNA